jgi:hypothetical protein
VLAQVVDQCREGGKFFLFVHEIYFDKFHEKLQDLFHKGNGMGFCAHPFGLERLLQRRAKVGTIE